MYLTQYLLRDQLVCAKFVGKEYTVIVSVNLRFDYMTQA